MPNCGRGSRTRQSPIIAAALTFRRLHRYARALRADRADRRAGKAAAANGSTSTSIRPRRASPTKRRRAPSRRSSATSSSATARPRHASIAPSIRNRSTRCSRRREAQPPARRRQMHDGSQRARGVTRHARKRGYDQSKALIEKWHGKGGCSTPITPRFGADQHAGAARGGGRALEGISRLNLQTHLAENRDEVALVNKLFPEREDFLDVYDHYGLVGRRSVLGHGICSRRLRDSSACHERRRLDRPLPDLQPVSRQRPFPHARRQGSEPSDPGRSRHRYRRRHQLLAARTLNEAYKVAPLNARAARPRSRLSTWRRSAARGARPRGTDRLARTGREADIVVLDPKATPLLAFRTARARSLEETLFMLMTLGDDRAVRATYVAGALAHAASPLTPDARRPMVRP